MSSRISASVMCADQLNLARDIDELQRAGVDFLHLDVMDGNYVPNITLGLDVCNAIKRNAEIPVDIHLLVVHPERYLASLNFGEGDMVSAHIEQIGDVGEFASSVRARGAMCGVVLNRGIDVERALPVTSEVDFVSLMMIEPGFAGLKMLDGSMEKIFRMRRMLDDIGREDIPIEVDGNVSFEHAGEMRANGADFFVAGSSSIFKADLGISAGVDLLSSVLGRCFA